MGPSSFSLAYKKAPGSFVVEGVWSALVPVEPRLKGVHSALRCRHIPQRTHAGFTEQRRGSGSMRVNLAPGTSSRECGLNARGAHRNRGCLVSGHRFKIGQLVSYLGRERVAGFYTVLQLLPSEDEVPQYRIKSVNEPHERVVKEHELRSTG
jgi:hypothetical protein